MALPLDVAATGIGLVPEATGETAMVRVFAFDVR